MRDGRTTNGMVIHWPARIKAKGEVRSQFTYVTDIAPTVLEAAGLPFPKSVNGAVQRPFDGTSMIYSFDNATAKETHTTQYFEMFGNRGIYHDGWVAAARHSIPWLMVPNPPLSQDDWELYHVADLRATPTTALFFGLLATTGYFNSPWRSPI